LELEGCNERFDFVVSGFTHHHLNSQARKLASKKMCAITKEGGFIGLVDETMTYVQYLEYRINHLLDKVQPAVESFLKDVNEHAKLFEDEGVVIRSKEQQDRFYYFSGIKTAEKKQTPISFLKADLWDYSKATRDDQKLYKKVLTYLDEEKNKLKKDQRYEAPKVIEDCIQVFCPDAHDALTLAFELQKRFEKYRPQIDYAIKGFRIILTYSRCVRERSGWELEFAVEASRIEQPMKSYIRQHYENPNQIWCTENFYNEVTLKKIKDVEFKKLPRLALPKDYPPVVLYRIVSKTEQEKSDIFSQIFDIPKRDLNALRLMIQSGESEEVEFKSSLRWDLKTQNANKELERVIVHTIAGFMNSAGGGTLLIGVGDDGTIIGIENDYKIFNKSRDGFMNHLNTLMGENCGKDSGFLFQVYFHKMDNKDVCQVVVKPSPKPVFVKEGNQHVLFVRMGNSTRELDSKDTFGYIMMRWHQRQ
jgi:hypothetical protein